MGINNYFWQGKSVRLREMRPQDTKLWLEEDIDSEGVRFLNYGMELPKTSKDAALFAEKYSYFKETNNRIMFSIENLEGELVGGMNIHTIDRKNGTFGIGSRIYREFRNRGYAEEAKRILLRYCFDELRLQKYNAGCMENNGQIIRHFKKLGCIEEGRRRKNIYTDGQFFDEILFGLTTEEFAENDREFRIR